MIIEAGYGLGEAIVSGQITPDSYVVEKHNSSQPPLTLRGGEKRIPSLRVREGEGELRILDKTVSTQERMLIRGKNSGTEWIPIPKTDQAKQKLTDAEILELSALILKIDNHYGFPVDVEFAQEKGKFYIVQSRPITTLRVL